MNTLFPLEDHDAQQPPPDITARKHGGNPNSVAANERAEPTKEGDRSAIVAWLRTQGLGGGTSKEYAAFTGRQLNCLSGRFSELLRDGLIHRTTMSRDGAAVYLLAKWANM